MYKYSIILQNMKNNSYTKNITLFRICMIFTLISQNFWCDVTWSSNMCIKEFFLTDILSQTEIDNF